jgi:hypothetical protein
LPRLHRTGRNHARIRRAKAGIGQPQSRGVALRNCAEQGGFCACAARAQLVEIALRDQLLLPQCFAARRTG